MKALLCREYGHFDKLRVEEIPAPALGPGQVRLRVRTAGVSFAVLLGIQGKHQNKPGLPYVPGGEAAGEVIEVAPDVTALKPGDRAVALLGSGAFGEEAVGPAANAWKIPDGMSDADALVMVGTYGSLYMTLVDAARLQPQDVLLVHGAGGGSGLGAVAIGKALGARIIASAGGAQKLQAARELGAAHLIDYREEDVRARVLELTDGRGADVIFDPVGGDTFDLSLRCIAPEGRIIPYGFAGGRIPQIPANILLVKNISAIGFYWGYYLGWAKLQPTEAARARVRDGLARLMGWAVEGRLPSMPSQAFPLADFRDAMKLVEERKVIGKVVLTL